MKNTLMIILAAILLLVSAIGSLSAAEALPDIGDLYKKKDVEANWDEDEVTAVDLTALSADTFTIDRAGTYLLSGSYTGRLIVDAKDEKVHIILNGANISSKSGPAIHEVSADKLIVTLAGDSLNTLACGEVLQVGEETIGAALYAEDDLSINGSGSLTISASAKHGIQCKKDLILANGQYDIRCEGDAVRGRNSVLILDGSFTIRCGGDGIASTRSDKDGKGWVIIAGGTFDIITGEGAGKVRVSTPFGSSWGTSRSASEEAPSQKAVKAEKGLTVTGGRFVIDCADDALHSNAGITIAGGTFQIKCADDAVHADGDLAISSGVIRVPQCFEGLEGANIFIDGGEISLVCSDDGINASGISTESANNRFRGVDETDNGAQLVINGGDITVDAGGDAIDSNGSFTINGGLLRCRAATMGGEGSIDFNGTGTVYGGTVLAVGTGGVMKDTAQLGGCPLLSVSVGSRNAGTVISVKDADGNELISYAPDAQFNSILFVSAAIGQGDTCTVMCGDEAVYSGKYESNVSSYGGFPGQGPGRPGGGWGNPGGRGR